MATDLEQDLIDLWWRDDTPQSAAQGTAMCTRATDRDHALWIAVATQKAGAVNALLDTGASGAAREGALSLICAGLVRAGDQESPAPTTWAVRPVLRLKRTDADPFWDEVEQVLGRYVEKYGDEGDWLTMIPELLGGVPSTTLALFIQNLSQAVSDEIRAAQAMLQAEIDRRILEAV